MSDKKTEMKIYDAQGMPLMSVKRLERDGNDLVIRGNVAEILPQVVDLIAAPQG